MSDYQREFLDLAVDVGALKFGEFTLKSGRKSPYFFNAGKFASGKPAAQLGRFYAAVIHARHSDCDMLFGPAYKGIPLAALSAAALADGYDMDLPYAFNRKEAKQHGEGGNIVGGALQGKVLIIDDVITAGTAIREAVTIIRDAGAQVGGIVISMDRQERGTGELSAVQEVEQSLGVRVSAIATFADLVTHLGSGDTNSEHLDAILAYRDAYGSRKKA